MDREFLGYKGLGDDVISSAPGILAIDPGTPTWANFVGAANPNSPGGLWPGTWRVQNVILKKETPDVFKCSDLFPQRVIQQQGTPNIRLWWPLMYEIPGTKWTLTIQYATSPIPDPNNPGKFLQYDDDGPGPHGPSPVHQEVWEWTVDADLQDLKNLLELFHELPFGKDEVPLISREDMYPVLQQKLSDIIALLNQDPPNTIEAANLILDFELEVADLCIQVSPIRPWPNSADTGIANTEENPACCKLIVDADYIGRKLGILNSGK